MVKSKKVPQQRKSVWKRILSYSAAYWRSSIWHKITIIFLSLVLLFVGFMYGIARWYIATEAHKPLIIGTSFIPAYAESLGLDPKQTMDALINDVGVRHFRLVSYWDQLEPSPGKYDFRLLDWQMQKVESAHAKVIMSVGLRQPRWPECHMPKWAANEPQSVWEPQLEDFMTAVVNRYKDSPSIDSWQVENEYLLKVFGTCTNFDRDRLVREYNLVKKLDPNHRVIVSRSNNAIGWPIGKPTPDEFGIAVYKRVWDATITHRYLEYPFPAWYYGFLAGWEKLWTGKDLMIHELQTEAWTPEQYSMQETSLDEQNKSFNADRFVLRMKYAEGTGMREIYTWGSEYWYYRLVKLHDPSLWNVARDTFKSSN
jgi:hypothetical protein